VYTCENLKCHRWPQRYTTQQFTQLTHQVCRLWMTDLTDSRQQSPSWELPAPQPENNFTISITILSSSMFPHHFSSTPHTPRAPSFSPTLIFEKPGLCTDTNGSSCSVHKQSAGLLRLNMADLHQFTFHYSQFLTKLNEHHRMLLVILYVMLQNTTFLILFSNLTSTSYDDEDNKKRMCARAHIRFPWKYKIPITCSWYKGTQEK